MAFKAQSRFPAWYEPWIHAGGSIMEYLFQSSSIFFNSWRVSLWDIFGGYLPHQPRISRPKACLTALLLSLHWPEDKTSFAIEKFPNVPNMLEPHHPSLVHIFRIFLHDKNYQTVFHADPISNGFQRLWSAVGLLCRLPRSHVAIDLHRRWRVAQNPLRIFTHCPNIWGCWY